MKQSEKALIASCGGYCRGCAFHYLAYVDEDERLKQAEALSRQLNMEIRLDEIGCLGCHGSKQSS